MDGIAMLEGRCEIGSEGCLIDLNCLVDVLQQKPGDKQSIQTMQNVQQMRNEQTKILQSFNTPRYSILVFE